MFTVLDIQKGSINLEPITCRNCKKQGADYNQSMGGIWCPYCGLFDDGSNISKQKLSQNIDT